MSSGKFAAITASLVARKGEAAPSVVVPATPRRPALVRRDDHFASEPRQPDNPEKPRRIMVLITPEELERLAIAAIKKGTSRHDIVRGALNDYFRKLAAELPQPCACMEGGPAVPARHAQSEASATCPSYPANAENVHSELLALNAAEEQVNVTALS